MPSLVSRPRVWRRAILTLAVLSLAYVAWSNRFGPAASPYLHRNRLTGAECHWGVECWVPRAPMPWAAPGGEISPKASSPEPPKPGAGRG